jgi:hypothetical protein
MCTSKRQVQSNQENAQLSTGPITPEGKAISSRNSLKHGLFARAVVINSAYHTEDPNEFQQLLDSLWEELQPETLFQQHLVRKIAHCLWRSQRAVIAETAHINHELDNVDNDIDYEFGIKNALHGLTGGRAPAPTEEEREAAMAYHVGKVLVPDRSFSHNILWYEMRLDRQISRAYYMLNLLKSRPTRTQENPVPDFHTETRPELAIFDGQ